MSQTPLTEEKVAMFRPHAPLEMPELKACLCDPDECIEATMLAITEMWDGKERAFVYVTLDEAAALRDWLNKVLP